MKVFYTVRDIEDMHAAGVAEIETHDDVVLTDVAREKAIALGMRLKPVESPGGRAPAWEMPRPSAASPPSALPVSGGVPAPPSTQPTAPASPPRSTAGGDDAERIMKVKAAVIARLGTTKYNDVLDRIIPQVMSQLKK